ncbi:MAG: hypothetical protein JXB48_11005 [Candidatus Latescibacteria bacterium]|nr:hypothetical protein [Candidatus Latescibacterota bacterium]
MGRRFLIPLIIVMIAVSGFAKGEPIIDRPKNMDEPTTEEKGILSTLVLIYTKTRDAVKFAYDEVQYFKDIHRNFKNMQAWFNRAKNRGEYIWDKSSELFTDPQNVFVTLDRLEDIFDHIDYTTWAVPRELDRILSRTEITYDNIVTGMAGSAGMVPNTDEALEYIDSKFGFNYLSVKNDKKYGKYIQKLDDAKEKGKTVFPEEEIVEASKQVAASSMSNSSMYRQWSLKTSQNIPQIDKNFTGVKGANGQELAACWYTIEQNNANNKLLMNHLEELKVLQATLGVYLYESSKYRSQELNFKNTFSDFNTNIP